mgnify:CR=1 FL=1
MSYLNPVHFGGSKAAVTSGARRDHPGKDKVHFIFNSEGGGHKGKKNDNEGFHVCVLAKKTKKKKSRLFRLSVCPDRIW